MPSGYAQKFLFPLSRAKISFFIMHRNFGARHYAGRGAKILAQSARYARHVDGNMDFFPVWLGCYGSFGYCNTTEALRVDTEQRSDDILARAVK